MVPPEAFKRLVAWFDFAIYAVIPEAKSDDIGFALDSITETDRSAVKTFLTITLADSLFTSNSNGALASMFRDAGARIQFENEAQLRAFLAEILRRIG